MTSSERYQNVFSKMHQDWMICEPDLFSVVRWTEDTYPGQRFERFYRDLKRVDPAVRPSDTASILSSYQSVLAHALMAPFTMRMTELLGSIPDEKSRIDHVIEMLEVYAKNPLHSRIRHYAVCATAGAFNYLAFRQSPHLSYLADSIIAKASDNPGFLRAILCPNATSEKAYDEIMLHQLRLGIERQGDLSSWIKKNIPSKNRQQMRAFTQWPEVIQAMTKISRGRTLEDELGM